MHWPDTLARIGAIAKDRSSRAPPHDPDVAALGYGLSYGVSCREYYPFATQADLAAAGRQAFPDYPASIQGEGVGGWAYVNQDCRDLWKVPAAPEAMRQPVAGSIPALLISGSFDTLTSLAGAGRGRKAVKSDIISIPGIGEPAFVAACHCTKCQRRTGSPFRVGTLFPKEQVRKVYVRGSDSGQKIEFHFCADCGSSVFWHAALYPDFVAIAFGTFADPSMPRPTLSVWEQTRHP